MSNEAAIAATRKKAMSARLAIPLPPPVPGARWIPLTKGLFAIVDESDYPAVCEQSWTAMILPRTRYAYYRRRLAGGQPTFLLHRVILGVTDSQQVDHRDGDGLNCRRYNMRVCSVRENHCNVRKRLGPSSSPLKGVIFDKSRLLWISRIKAFGKSIHLGRFQTELEAALAYDSAAKLHFGEFARLNFQ